MIRIATLGPSNTFTELAARKYLEETGAAGEVHLYPTFGKTFAAVGRECDLAVLAIENMSEGYVPVVLDLLVHSELRITHELLLPIQFAFVANCERLDQVTRVYSQFVAQGQCERLLDSLNDVAIITTESNGTSLEEVRRGRSGEGAVVPAFAVKPGDFPLVLQAIADRSNNLTRFIAIAPATVSHDQSVPGKTSVLVVESVDRPGILSEILTTFSSRNINLVSIMSRPTKEALGKYHFFIDIEGYDDEAHIKEALAELAVENAIKVLGSYPRARQPAENAGAASGTAGAAGLGASPFQRDGARPAVTVAWGKSAYENTRQALRAVDLSVARGKKVLLKPNAGRCMARGSGVVTDPDVVAAAIDAFREVGAVVAVGESPITGVNTLEALEQSGIAAVATARDCPLIDLDARPPVRVSVPDGVAIQALKVGAEVLEYDLVVSIPVMKTHMHTGVSLAVKNMKGCLWRRSKVDLHMLPEIDGCSEKPLNVAIADMASVLRPHLSIIDGTVGLEGLGPSCGTPKPVGVVVVGADAFAADAVACRLMGIDPREVPHLRLGAARGLGVIDLDGVDVGPEHWVDHAVTFAPPPANLSLKFPGVTVLDERSCSACQSTLLLFMQRHGDRLLEYFGGAAATVAIGKGHVDVPLGTLCIGNCTARHRTRGTFVPGCPPVVSQVLQALTRPAGPATGPGHNG